MISRRRVIHFVQRCLSKLGLYSRPGFLIIGAQKGGTTSLFYYLSTHPNIKPPIRKEVCFFCTEKLLRKGESWYHSYFPPPISLGNSFITFDATPEYMYYPLCPKRIFSYDPHMKLIALLRDPVERAFSAWNMFYSIHKSGNIQRFLSTYSRRYDDPVFKGIVNLLSTDPFPKFDTLVRDEVSRIVSGDSTLEPGFVRRGLYHEQLLRYLDYFDRQNLLIIESKRLKDNPVVVLEEVIQFLGFPKYGSFEKSPAYYIQGVYTDVMSSETRSFLSEFYGPYNQKLYELTGYDFKWQ
jgi:hypothetical protein